MDQAQRYQAQEPPPASFTVELARSGVTLQVAQGEAILQHVLAAGVAAPSSCQTGVCGLCETTVLQGAPLHRDRVLSRGERAAGKTMMICCSGSRSPALVLDL